MPATENLYLIGYRGSGKSSVGRLVAAGLQRPFLDADALLCARAGCSIAEFVAARGWAAFRRLESKILHEISGRSGLVFATGGGVILEPENRRRLAATGRVIWLEVGYAETVRRLAADADNAGQRPPLSAPAAADPCAGIARDLREREPLYREIADFRIVVDGLALDEIVARILRYLNLSK